MPYVEQAFGSWYVPGGLRRLGDAVARRAAEAGAELRTGADVARVLVDDRGLLTLLEAGDLSGRNVSGGSRMTE